MRASWLTRVLYVLALLAIVLASLATSTGWIGLAFGGGLAVLGSLAIPVLIALLTYRGYQVLRYADTLDSRRPNVFGRILRFGGQLFMGAGAVGLVSLLLVKPLTLTLLKSAGDGGVGYFVVGIWATLLTSSGWLGCVAFEVSRFVGERGSFVKPAVIRKSPQDYGVMASIAVVLIAGWAFLQQRDSTVACGESNVAQCVSNSEVAIHRMMALQTGGAIALDTKLDEIEFRGKFQGRPWTLTESPSVSLEKAGYVVADLSGSKVRVSLDAIENADQVVLTMVIRNADEETARFVTRFNKGTAKIETLPGGRTKLVVTTTGSVKYGMRSAHTDPRTKKYVYLDQLFIFLRRGIGVQQEANEWAQRIVRNAIPRNSGEVRDPVDTEGKLLGPTIDTQCAGLVEGKAGSVLSTDGNLGWPLWELKFARASDPDSFTFLSPSDKVICRDSEIWIVSYATRRPELRLRKFSQQGKLIRFVDTTLPKPKLETLQHDHVNPQSVREVGGSIHFDRVLVERSSSKPYYKEVKRDLFELKL